MVIFCILIDLDRCQPKFSDIKKLLRHESVYYQFQKHLGVYTLLITDYFSILYVNKMSYRNTVIKISGRTDERGGVTIKLAILKKNLISGLPQ